MNSGRVLFLSSADVRTLLTLDECTAAVELAFRLHGEGRTVPPAVLGLHVSHGGFHVKAGLLSLSRNYFAAKVNAAGTALVYLTYLGTGYMPLSPNTNPSNFAEGIAADAQGNIYGAEVGPRDVKKYVK